LPVIEKRELEPTGDSCRLFRGNIERRVNVFATFPAQIGIFKVKPGF
jgi:hypothetical protein